MMKLLIILIAVIVLCHTYCSPALKVDSDFDKSADITGYRTFTIYPADSGFTSISPLNAQRIAKAISKEMVKKGYQQTTGNADLLINAIAVIKDKVSLNANTNYYGYGGVYRPYYWGAAPNISYTTYNLDTYKEGSLLIDILDGKSKKLIWQAIGDREIDGPLPQPESQIPEGIAKIMASFPATGTVKSGK